MLCAGDEILTPWFHISRTATIRIRTRTIHSVVVPSHLRAVAEALESTYTVYTQYNSEVEIGNQMSARPKNNIMPRLRTRHDTTKYIM